MAGLNLNIGSSVVKRESRPFNEVMQQLRTDGWTVTEKFKDRLAYIEKSGVNLTVVNGPLGTVILPSGPVRGRMFGDSGLMLNRDTVLGSGRVEGEAGRQKRKSDKMSNTIT